MRTHALRLARTPGDRAPRLQFRVFRFSIATLAACSLIAAGAAITTTGAPQAQAASSTTGLYGAADPQWDGSFRQALAILGLIAVGKSPDPSAITWLLAQQCADGSFQAYRANLDQPCAAPDPLTSTGPQVDSTAVAATALLRVGTPAARKAALRAMAWITSQQGADGGWPYIGTGESNANSTGMALVALRALGGTQSKAAITKATAFLGTLTQPCTASDGARLSYQAGSAPDWSATAQGALGLNGSLPVAGPRALRALTPCEGNTRQVVNSALAKGLQQSPLLPSSFDTSPDETSTAFSVLALVSGGQGRASVASGVSALQATVRAYATPSAVADPAALGLLLLVAKATGVEPTNFGGVNLVRTLQQTVRR